MEKICCVEDGKEYQLLIENALRGYDVVFCSTLSEAKTTLDQNGRDFSLMILDISLPDGNGIHFLSEARLQMDLEHFPVFVVSSNKDIMTKVTAFGVGVDDYICKPFEALELRARVEAKFRQIRSKRNGDNRIQFGDLSIDLARMQIYTSGQRASLDMTPIEFKLLALLAKSPGQVFSRAQIIEEIWGPNTAMTDRTVDAHVSHLRKKIASSSVEIGTVPSAGYKVTLKHMC